MARAILSVSDKRGIETLARALHGLGYEIVATGGTATAIEAAGIPVRTVESVTGAPEMLGGRVKTLHPSVHGGILARRDVAEDMAALARHGIATIDVVVVNLYPFRDAVARGADLGEAVEEIDIGGPSLVRAAAKNHRFVVVVVDPQDYPRLVEEIAAGGPDDAARLAYARKAFAHTAGYDSEIAAYLLERTAPATFPERLTLALEGGVTLRYGENPHQRAALYADGSGLGIAGANQLQGKELSFNNLVDLEACWELAGEFDEPMVAIIKHTNPCGAATGATILDAYQKALACDPVSAFGSVIGINREVDGAAAEEIAKLFVEAIAAPAFTAEARERFAAKKNLRLVEVHSAPPRPVVKHVSGGLLLQDADTARITESELKVVTWRPPTAEEMRSLLFAWRVCKHVKSNAIVYVRDGQTVGIGAGQMSRVDAARFGAQKAVLPLQGTVAASDAFFPFPDGLEAVASAGATAVIQPGGSVKDQDVIAAADKLGMAMVFTGIRHFRH